MFYIRSDSPEDWRKLLADPKIHWRDGYSAKSLAYAWQLANGFPRKVKRMFQDTIIEELKRNRVHLWATRVPDRFAWWQAAISKRHFCAS